MFLVFFQALPASEKDVDFLVGQRLLQGAHEADPLPVWHIPNAPNDFAIRSVNNRLRTSLRRDVLNMEVFLVRQIDELNLRQKAKKACELVDPEREFVLLDRFDPVARTCLEGLKGEPLYLSVILGDKG